MARVGGQEFTDFSVPLVFGDRYFIRERSDPPHISVFSLQAGLPMFEILKNRPAENPRTFVAGTSRSTVTVIEKATRSFLYGVRAGTETSVQFAKLGGGAITARITDSLVQVGDLTAQNDVFTGTQTGLAVDPSGKVRVGDLLPDVVAEFLAGK